VFYLFIIYLTRHLIRIIGWCLKNNELNSILMETARDYLQVESLRLPADPEGHKDRHVVVAAPGW
jgi:hypothetical protein